MQTVTVLHDQTIYDIAVQVYGNIQGVFWLMQDNPGTITDLDDDLTAGTVLKIDLTRKKQILISKSIPQPVTAARFSYDKVTNGQTIYDRAVQDYGSVDALFDVINNMGLDSVDDQINAGDIIRIDAQSIRDTQMVGLFKNKNIRMNTHELIDFEGVDFWGIEIDFLVN